MVKLNCWEFKNCGRQPGGQKVLELGVCPASEFAKTDGVNSGKNGGRACWVIAGTLCGGKVQGTYAAKLTNCMGCEFYKKVSAEESENYSSSKEIMTKINS